MLLKKKNPKKGSIISYIKRNMHYLMIGLGIVMFWRGVWDLLDVYLFPENEILSSVVCVVVSLVIFLVDNKELEELDL